MHDKCKQCFYWQLIERENKMGCIHYSFTEDQLYGSLKNDEEIINCKMYN